jgi:tetratricopeptide (TPR) repeat protein
MTPTLSVESYDHQPATGARKAARRAARLSAKERHDEAIEELRRALAIDPQYYLAENNLGLEFRRAGKPDLAIATLEHLSKSAPSRVLAFNNLAEILYEAQRYPEMETVARQAQKDTSILFQGQSPLRPRTGAPRFVERRSQALPSVRLAKAPRSKKRIREVAGTVAWPTIPPKSLGSLCSPKATHAIGIEHNFIA